MSVPHPPKVAGIDPSLPSPSHTADPAAPAPLPPPNAVVLDRLAGWVSDLTTLHELTERLTRTRSLDSALHELLRAGAALVGARRGLVTLEPADGLGPVTTVGLGLGRADLGYIETIPRGTASAAHLLDGLPEAHAPRPEVVHPDLAREAGLDPRHREVATRLGYAASYAVPLDPLGEPTDEGGAPVGRLAAPAGRLGAAVWLYDEPTEPFERQRHLLGLYCRHAAEHVARLVELTRARDAAATLHQELLPARLPRVPGVRLAVRHRTGPDGGGDWYDALSLPEGALGLAIGSVSGSGPGAVAAMGRLRASLRAYAVMEGEDPVAVLSDLEMLLRLTEPARTATALFAYCEPLEAPPGSAGGLRIVLAGAGHCPPLIVGEHRTEFVETSLSAPLGMLSCWEAPSMEIEPAAGETLLLYSDGLLHRTGDEMDRAFARLHAAAAGAPRVVRQDPDALVDHVLRTVLPDGLAAIDRTDDVILLAARFD
ncbi:PP2C family protein-serine/threonine phosphatase [Streptomyces sp. XD-27]|uniref:PP2C family protein-serine/threonine phosphatase n=1 Tax=Streptomyces sp. XD-27 TaxID=3062779 RepID=UPI0026F43E14|nr:PP2C family protein-serine/threonine phosphatase [Streptomyces sp. XD-27]WKX71650.1 PP2C family protein-serine/threonine phosphatase [Streptomyces sp. XD-27]